MPWVHALLRGQRVFARADEQGRLVASGGKVEIRYKPTDGRRYDAGARNLTVEEGSPVLPDEACAPAETVARPDPAGPASPSARPGATGPSRAKKAPPSAGSRERSLAAAHAGEIVVAYTDGACSGNPGPAGLGVVVLDAGARQELGEYLGLTTNNVAELTAILRALEMVEDRARKLLVHTDSQYAIGVLTKGWKAKANVELIATIRGVLSHCPKAQLIYVPGHAGVEWNERADELARLAVSGRKTFRKAIAAKGPTEPDGTATATNGGGQG